jgi:orotate phosphoribosyltransferase
MSAMPDILSLSLGEARKKLMEIVNEKAVFKGDFTLASGQKSNYYIDGKFISLTSDGLAYFAKVILEMIKKDGVKYIGGPTLGADPIIGGTVAMSHLIGRPLDGFIIRKEQRDHGRMRMIEGPLKEGSKVIIVEDVTTTGGSVLKGIKRVEEMGCEVVKIICLVDRLQGAEENFKKEGYNFTPIFKVNELDID